MSVGITADGLLFFYPKIITTPSTPEPKDLTNPGKCVKYGLMVPICYNYVTFIYYSLLIVAFLCSIVMELER